MPQPQYGSDLIVDLLHRYGIKYAALNPGASFRGLHDSIVNYGGNRPEIIECPHEKLAVGIAHGYAKATGEPMAAILHNLVGLLHGSLGIYTAYCDRVPILVLGATGPMEAGLRRARVDWDHTALVQGNAVRSYVKWDDQPFGAEAVVDSVARGYRVAMTEPQGPVYLCYDVAFQEDKLPRVVPLPAEQHARLYTSMHADPEAVAQAADWLTRAERPVIVTDLSGRHPSSFHTLVALAEQLAAPVVDLNGRLNFPNRHPLWSPDQEPLGDADCVLLLDCRDPWGALTVYPGHAPLDQRRDIPWAIPSGCRLIEIGLGDLNIHGWSQQFQRYLSVDLSVLADTRTALPALLNACQERVAAGNLPAAASTLQAARRLAHFRAQQKAQQTHWQEQARVNWDAQPMTTARLAAEVWAAIQGEDWVLTANTLCGWTHRLWNFDQPGRHAGKSLGTATQIGISLGVALAHKGTGKLVVNIQPDGDLMFDTSALWIATHHKIPMLVVMFNNRAYYNDWSHGKEIARQRDRDERMAYLGMEINHPAPDFAALARSFDWYAEGPLADGRQVRAAVTRAIQVIRSEGRPALVDCVTQFR